MYVNGFISLTLDYNPPCQSREVFSVYVMYKGFVGTDKKSLPNSLSFWALITNYNVVCQA